MRMTAALATLAFAFATSAGAQTSLDVGALQDIDDVDVVTADGTEVGEIEDVLIDRNGNVVAVVVETNGFLDIDDDERVFALDQLSFDNGNFVTSLTAEEVDALPRYDD